MGSCWRHGIGAGRAPSLVFGGGFPSEYCTLVINIVSIATVLLWNLEKVMSGGGRGGRRAIPVVVCPILYFLVGINLSYRGVVQIYTMYMMRGPDFLFRNLQRRINVPH